MDLNRRVAQELTSVRARTLALLEPLDDQALLAQHSPIMSPLVWDLAHVGNYEDLWLVRALGEPAVGPQHDHLYDAFQHPRRDRPALPLLDPAAARRYIGEVRDRTLDRLHRVGAVAESPLLDGAFVYGMVVQHEHQHDETILATLQLMEADGYDHLSSAAPAPASTVVLLPSQVLIDGGTVTIGTDTEPWAYDNERGAHDVTVSPFWIDTTPVTNRAYAEFVDAGGYDDPRWWTPDGWAWRRSESARAPLFWRRDGAGGWEHLRFGRWAPLVPDEPVQHVSWYEADAYARFRGMRLPTEIEWEAAASVDPVTGRKRRYPWGDDDPSPRHANLGQQRLGPAPVGSHSEGATPAGVHQMIGDVWEWTASDFAPWPGFTAFPYREYSEVFFGATYKVLRGGSWATHPTAVRSTFRNWDLPIRRQIFAGFRCAADV